MCVVSPVTFSARVKLWMNTFLAKQMIVLTLDQFSGNPAHTLTRLSRFLGVNPFPQMVLNWNWQWNTGTGTKRASAVSPRTISRLRAFFGPHNLALAELLKHRRQYSAAEDVLRWPSGNETV
eukprot:3418340-Pleurochrysis_carterae.AAC.3